MPKRDQVGPAPTGGDGGHRQFATRLRRPGNPSSAERLRRSSPEKSGFIRLPVRSTRRIQG